ncbi:MAG: biotin/lipoyl-binding protein, partial [Desulfocapsaceae bacterium]|nr:biotin/lipoyl-binding protein [Desulfocapsaceae bacterium]
MSTSFRLPDLGEGVHEAEILDIPVKEGQAVKEGDIILEVETDKAAVEIPSPTTGIIQAIKISQGETVKVGDVLIVFAGDETHAEEVKATAGEPDQEKVETEPTIGKGSTPVPASPSTRRIARELGVDLRQVTPSGDNGIV